MAGLARYGVPAGWAAIVPLALIAGLIFAVWRCIRLLRKADEGR
jgi:hypothetical protein